MSSCSTISGPRCGCTVQDGADIAVRCGDGHRWSLPVRAPRQPRAVLTWIPALGIAARHYLAFADALSLRGIAVAVHEWRGHGSSNLRAARDRDWGYRALLADDLPATRAAVAARWPRLPRILGGHSLGGQLACCQAALDPEAATRLWLVGSGSPYWRAFPAPLRWGLPLACRFLPWLADRAGALPGRRIGFGGNEARGVIRDWAATALAGRYAAPGIDVDLESALQRVAMPVDAVLMADDWLAPASSLRFLLGKLPQARASVRSFDATALGVRADHYAWMRQPAAIADWLATRI